MDIDHLHFYVEDAQRMRDWLVQRMGFVALAGQVDARQDTQVELVGQGAVRFLLSSARSPASPVARYLKHHPPGIVDIALRVEGLEQGWKAFLSRLPSTPLEASTDKRLVTGLHHQDGLVWGAIALCDTLRHTLIERSQAPLSDLTYPGITLTPYSPVDVPSSTLAQPLEWIDHVVLNVPQGKLEAMTDWYARVFGFQQKQSFRIKTSHSGLQSAVMQDATGTIQIPINEPATANSQIQEFLDCNRGAGVQHVALRTRDAIATVSQLRQRQVPFIEVPATYYEALLQREGCRLTPEQVRAIAAQKLLVDWQANDPQALLLQTFTHPVFAEPTLFFEMIERQATQSPAYALSPTAKATQPQTLTPVQGFGERNFQALFEAIEQEQIRRGSLQSSHQGSRTT